jgi:hypothetical protein
MCLVWIQLTTRTMVHGRIEKDRNGFGETVSFTIRPTDAFATQFVDSVPVTNRFQQTSLVHFHSGTPYVEMTYDDQSAWIPTFVKKYVCTSTVYDDGESGMVQESIDNALEDLRLIQKDPSRQSATEIPADPNVEPGDTAPPFILFSSSPPESLSSSSPPLQRFKTYRVQKNGELVGKKPTPIGDLQLRPLSKSKKNQLYHHQRRLLETGSGSSATRIANAPACLQNQEALNACKEFESRIQYAADTSLTLANIARDQLLAKNALLDGSKAGDNARKTMEKVFDLLTTLRQIQGISQQRARNLTNIIQRNDQASRIQDGQTLQVGEAVASHIKTIKDDVDATGAELEGLSDFVATANSLTETERYVCQQQILLLQADNAILRTEALYVLQQAQQTNRAWQITIETGQSIATNRQQNLALPNIVNTAIRDSLRRGEIPFVYTHGRAAQVLHPILRYQIYAVTQHWYAINIQPSLPQTASSFRLRRQTYVYWCNDQHFALTLIPRNSAYHIEESIGPAGCANETTDLYPPFRQTSVPPSDSLLSSSSSEFDRIQLNQTIRCHCYVVAYVHEAQHRSAAERQAIELMLSRQQPETTHQIPNVTASFVATPPQYSNISNFNTSDFKTIQVQRFYTLGSFKTSIRSVCQRQVANVEDLRDAYSPLFDIPGDTLQARAQRAAIGYRFHHILGENAARGLQESVFQNSTSLASRPFCNLDVNDISNHITVTGTGLTLPYIVYDSFIQGHAARKFILRAKAKNITGSLPLPLAIITRRQAYDVLKYNTSTGPLADMFVPITRDITPDPRINTESPLPDSVPRGVDNRGYKTYRQDSYVFLSVSSDMVPVNLIRNKVNVRPVWTSRSNADALQEWTTDIQRNSSIVSVELSGALELGLIPAQINWVGYLSCVFNPCAPSVLVLNRTTGHLDMVERLGLAGNRTRFRFVYDIPSPPTDASLRLRQNTVSSILKWLDGRNTTASSVVRNSDDDNDDETLVDSDGRTPHPRRHFDGIHFRRPAMTPAELRQQTGEDFDPIEMGPSASSYITEVRVRASPFDPNVFDVQCIGRRASYEGVCSLLDKVYVQLIPKRNAIRFFTKSLEWSYKVKAAIIPVNGTVSDQADLSDGSVKQLVEQATNNGSAASLAALSSVYPRQCASNIQIRTPTGDRSQLYIRDTSLHSTQIDMVITVAGDAPGCTPLERINNTHDRIRSNGYLRFRPQLYDLPVCNNLFVVVEPATDVALASPPPSPFGSSVLNKAAWANRPVCYRNIGPATLPQSIVVAQMPAKSHQYQIAQVDEATRGIQESGVLVAQGLSAGFSQIIQNLQDLFVNESAAIDHDYLVRMQRVVDERKRREQELELLLMEQTGRFNDIDETLIDILNDTKLLSEIDHATVSLALDKAREQDRIITEKNAIIDARLPEVERLIQVQVSAGLHNFQTLIALAPPHFDFNDIAFLIDFINAPGQCPFTWELRDSNLLCRSSWRPSRWFRCTRGPWFGVSTFVLALLGTFIEWALIYMVATCLPKNPGKTCRRLKDFDTFVVQGKTIRRHQVLVEKGVFVGRKKIMS